MDSGMAFQMTGDDRKRTDWLWDWHETQLREVDYWIAMSEKVGANKYADQLEKIQNIS